MCPDSDILDQLGGPFDRDAWLAKAAGKGTIPGATGGSGALVERSESRGRAVQPKLPPVDADDLDPSDNEMTARDTLERHMRNLAVDPGHPRFFGKSSSVMFLQTAMALKQSYTSEPLPALDQNGRRKVPSKRPEYWRAHSVSRSQVTLVYQK